MLPPLPWIVTQRSGPGFRIEAADGTLIAYGPEPPEAAGVAQELVMLMNSRHLLDERIEMLESTLKMSAHVIDEHRVANEAATVEVAKLRELLDETYETIIDGDSSECGYLVDIFEKKEYTPNYDLYIPTTRDKPSERSVRKNRRRLTKPERPKGDIDSS